MKRIVILGAAESGIGAALLAQQRGFDVFISDKNVIGENSRNELIQHSIPFEENQHSEEIILAADEIIKSPGISEKASIMKVIREKNIPVISEIEFAFRFARAPVIAITGTNGKSTTTTLIYHILRKAGLNASLVGNIGKSFARQIFEKESDYYVAEISSFQLDDCYEFRPHIAVLTNITDNHLDRYDYSMEKYADAKLRITLKQTADNYFITCADDANTLSALKRHTSVARQVQFSQMHQLKEGASILNNEIIFTLNHKTISMSLVNLGLQGRH